MTIEDDFPLGDGTADTSAWITCPYCAEEIELILDPDGGAHQQYIEDCEVCCRPMTLTASWDETGHAVAIAQDAE